MSEPGSIREIVFTMVANGEIEIDAAMALLKRSDELDAARPAAPAAGAGKTAGAMAGAGSGEAIAVVGMAGRFGEAGDLDAYWRLIEAGGNVFVPMPERRWPDLSGERRKGGFLPDEDRFDPLFFRISPGEAAMMDPQQRLFLESAYHALEDAGYAEKTLSGSRCGVFVGAGAGDYAQRHQGRGLESDPLGLMGNVASILAARISYFLNLKGPSVSLDTACSSSLVAVHLACESLRAGTSDMALAGGVAVISTPNFLGAMVEGGMLSRADRCRPFDAAGDGFVCGEGAGVVVLKRLPDAVRDGDQVYGLIRASSINQDGRTNGITAPSAPSQAALVREVLAASGVDPARIGYVETHGTGTPLGDPIEIEALTKAFGPAARGTAALGSVKANIGHTLTAAGIAGLLKVLLMLRHKTIPPLADFEAPNPRIDFAASPLRIPQAAEPWAAEGRRLASVSSFGFSGTNAHVLVEEAAPRPATRAAGPRLALLSAKSEAALRQRAEDLAAYLDGAAAAPLADIAFTLAAGRAHYDHRLAIVAEDPAGLAASLRAWLAGRADGTTVAGTARAEGPGPALTAFGAQVARETPTAERLLVLADLYTQGARFDLATLPGIEGGRRTSLPCYPFERVVCSLDGAPVGAPRAAPEQPAAATTAAHREAAPQPAAAPPLTAERFEADPLAALGSALGAAGPAAGDLPAKAEAFQAIEAWGRRALAAAYGEAGLFARHVYTQAGLAKALGVVPAKRRLHDALVDMLVRDGTLQREDDLLRVAPRPEHADLDAERARIEATAPDLAPFLTLLATCVAALPRIVSGAITATEVMFPDGRMDLVEPIYRGSQLAEHFNRLLAEAVATLAGEAGAPLRVLEIGAGTGGATIGILDALAEAGCPVRFTFTDISHGFVEQGRQTFGRPDGSIAFALLDIEVDPSAQGFEPGAYDVVIASNVVHACRRIDTALGHIGQLMRPGGVLLLNEVTALQDYATLTFGLTDGWWGFEDADGRIANAPLLSVSGWHAALGAAGFGAARAFGLPWEKGERFSQSVIAARRDLDTAQATPHATPQARPAPALAAESVTASGDLEGAIAAEVAAVLRMAVERLDRRGRFMDYGIDSILGGQLVARLNALLGLAMRPTVVFDHPTIRDLARHIEAEHGDAVRLVRRAGAATAPRPDAPAAHDAAPATYGATPAAPGATSAAPVAAPAAPNAVPVEALAAPTAPAAQPAERDERIAVIGMSGRFADCADLSGFRAMLREGRSGITEVPADRWSAEPDDLPEGVSSEAVYLRRGGFLKNAGDFDPLFFRISGKEAELTDPQHRLFLTEAWRTLEDAGYAEDELDGMRCGVFVGAYGGDYTHRMTEVGMVPEAFAFMGNAASILAARIAYILNLKGPSLAVDTACSSSLTAIHLACRSLLDGDCDMALAGGVFITTTMGFNTAAAKAGMLSLEGACKTFDASADGFVPGEGVGVVLLKPYAQAVADGDHIDAVILATAINQDGRTNGITAPSPQSQSALEAEAYRKAGIGAESVSYIEAHGTGTPLGDPIEIQGLTGAFRQSTARTGFCAIGSVKTNIGHAAHAAGIAGFLKTVLQLKHRELYPSLNFAAENPQLRLAETPFVVNTKLRPWACEGRRIAGLSSFGFSGTNVHIVLAEAEPAPARVRAEGPCLVTLSARTPAGLKRRVADLAAALGGADIPPALADIARTLNAGRSHFEHRWAAVVGSTAELATALADPSAAPIDTTGGRAADLLAAATAYLTGAPLPAAAIPAEGRRIALPTYPFEMRRYWLDHPGAPAAPEPQRANYLVPVWRPEPAAGGPAPRRVWIVGQSGPAPALAEALGALGHAASLVVDAAAARAADGAPDAVVVVDTAPDGGIAAGPRTVLGLVQTLFSDPLRVLYLTAGAPEQSATQALRRSAWFDGARVDLQVMDVARMDTAMPLAQAVATELAAPVEAAGEARYAGAQRMVRRHEIALAPEGAASPIRRGGHVVITGGGGVLAGAFARRLAGEFGCKISLIGRSPAGGAVETLLQAVPGTIYRRADVTDPAALAAALDAARGAHGPIHGVVHAAGVPAGAMLRQASWEEVARCLAPKVAGTMALDAALAGEPLAFFALFASLAGELGDFGQGAYALANAYCDRFAAWREAERLGGRRTGRTVALDWPLWREGRGVMSEEGERVYLATSSMPYLETETGWRAFLDALAIEAPQVAVMPGRAETALALFATPHHAPEGTADDPNVAPASPERPAEAVPAAAAADAGALEGTVREAITALISAQMKIDADLLGPDTGLADFGFDSIALKEFAVRLGEAYGINVSPALFFAKGTIAALAAHLAQTEPAAVAARHAAAPPAPEPAPAPAAPRATDGAIAVIGMAGRFPHSPDLSAFWHHLEEGHDLVGPLPEGRTLAGPEAETVGGFLERIDTFDAAFFKISAREAAFLDPQHRLAIEAVWHAVEDAGIAMRRLAGRPVGVFFGPQVNEYGGIIPNLSVARAQVALGNIATMLPNRISYMFDLRGPSEAIDTACSSSLVAVHRAVRALQAGECEMALAGGVSLVLSAESIVSTMELGVISPDGRCHSFDAAANGYVKGEGVGVVLLKPLAQAVADGDPVHAIIKGSAENHGGRAHSLTAPNGTAQAALIAEAIRKAGVASETISYVEAHGTGTDLGDPVEVLALTEAFAATSEPGAVSAPACGLGTVKTNIGHLEPASGIAGLIKTVLALKHRTLPASLHFETLNPLIDFRGTPFSVVDRARPWVSLTDRDGAPVPRRAGVSSFGLGGSNVHVVVEEAAGVAPTPAPAGPLMLFVSARDRERLVAALSRLADACRERADLNVADIAHTLVVGREPMAARAAVLWRPGQAAAERFARAAEVVAGGTDADDVWSASLSRTGLAGAASSGAAAPMGQLQADGRWADLAALWTGGADLPADLVPGRRVSLPGYPFAPTRHWFDQAPGAGAPPDAPPPAAAAPSKTPTPGQVQAEGAAQVPGTAARSSQPQTATPAAHMVQPPAPTSSAASNQADLAPSDPAPSGRSAPAVPPSAEPASGLAERGAFSDPGADTFRPASAVPRSSFDEVLATVRREVAQMLYLEEDHLDLHAPFTELGLDSILAVELTRNLNAALGTQIQATRLYDHANVADLAAFLAADTDTAPLDTTAPPPSAAPVVVPAPAAETTGPSLAWVSEVVRRQLAKALYLDEAQLDDRIGFEDLGLDSILAVELAKSLNDALGTQIQAPRLYDTATVADLAADLHAELSVATTARPDAGSEVAEVLFACLADIGATGLTLSTRLDGIALEPAAAKRVLADLNARFGIDLTEADVGRCRDIGSLVALIEDRAASADSPQVAQLAEAAPPARAFEAEPTAPAARPARPVPFTADSPDTTDTPVAAPPAFGARPVTATHPQVAIIGYACRLPGAPDAGAFWDLLTCGAVAVGAEPGEEWRRQIYREGLAGAGSSAPTPGGYLGAVDRFDAAFFNIRPDEARLMDPLQRLFLETAWHALESAGQSRAALERGTCGVFVGGGPSDYSHILEAHPGSVQGAALIGNTASVLAARIAYFLNLRGPCVSMDTACSSGLVAMHAACRAIEGGECDTALVGGVNLLLTPQMHMLTGAGGMISASGACHSFDDAADGFVPAEGVVALVLKRLDKAEADGDPVAALVQGIGVNHNGTTAGLSAPSAKAQARLLRDLYARADIKPAEIGLVEAHGTGTKIGDALEFDALSQVFREAGAAPGTSVLASAKPAIGHAFAASGLASVVKLVLAIAHRTIPPTLGPQRTNEHMALAGSPFRLSDRLEPWPEPIGGRRMAATTAYGLSGTNAHVVLAEPPTRKALPAPPREAHLVALSAPDAAGLARVVAALRQALAGLDDIADLAYTLGPRRTHFTHRAAFVVRDLGDLSAQLEAWPTTLPASGPADLESAASAYRAGATPDWSVVTPAGTVCALPPYPFAPERHWPGEAAEVSETAVASASRRTTPSTPDAPMERLRGLLADLLRVEAEALAADVSFDVLGVDSATGLMLMRAAEDAFGVHLPAIALWDHPTLAQLAAFIESRPPAARAAPSLALAGRTASGAHDPLVPIRDGTGGPASFWVHGGPGDVNWVPELARHMDPRLPVYGLEAVGLDGESEPLATVEAMAAHYVEAVRRVGGPYVLGAYSGGGAIALEMAHQLIAAGESVGRLVLLDCNAPGQGELEAMQAAFGPGHVYLVVANWLGTRWGASQPLRLADFDGLDKDAMLERAISYLFTSAEPAMDEAQVRHHLVTLDRVGWAVGDALRRYQPRPLPAHVPVTLFECRQGMAGGENRLALPDTAAARTYRDGWEGVVGAPIERVGFDCDHFALLRGEIGAAVGDRVAALLSGERGAVGEAPAAPGRLVPEAAAPQDPVADLVLSLVRETLPDVAPGEVSPERTMSELGATSIDRVEVATLAMEQLGITAPHQELAAVSSIGDLIALLNRHRADA